MPKITAYCMPWHVTRSPAFRELVVAPLAGQADIELVGWSGCEDGIPADGPRPHDKPWVFCQYAPPTWLLQDARARVVWVPMWDDCRFRPRAWWASLPSRLRVVAFSDAVARRATEAGLKVLSIRYFRDPDQHEPVTWDKGRVLLYWNRIGLASTAFLRRLCEALRVDRLLFDETIDPGLPFEAALDLPERLGATTVLRLPPFSHRDEFLAATRSANLFLAPRPSEGVGVAMLEQLARGAAVLAYDAPTMNEYIDHGKTGYLLRPSCVGTRIRGSANLAVQALRRTIGLDLRRTPIDRFSLRQDWHALGGLAVQSLGSRAREAQRAGHARFRAAAPEYARFVLDW